MYYTIFEKSYIIHLFEWRFRQSWMFSVNYANLLEDNVTF